MKVTIEDKFGNTVIIDNAKVEFTMRPPAPQFDSRPLFPDGRRDSRYGPGPVWDDPIEVNISGRIYPTEGKLPPLRFE
jgi:hypothetical protein